MKQNELFDFEFNEAEGCWSIADYYGKDEKTNEKNKKNPASSAGLFWLSKDYSTITDIGGLKEFTADDVASGILVQPIGGHHLYDFPRDTPRGRVKLQNGKLKIYLGNDFPKEKLPVITAQVISLFNLEKYQEIVMPVFHYHWNTKKIDAV